MVTAAARPRVLLVDDEEQVLRSTTLSLRREYEVETATSGTRAIEVMAQAAAPFAVVVSDMRMPGMSGAQFLAAVHQRWPRTVRVLLTGQSDLSSTIAAVNEGQIFRFLSKPTPAEDLKQTLAAAVHQHELIAAEKDLLENTLRASLEVLTDVLSLVNPEAFSCASRAAEVVAQLAEKLGLPEPWQVQVAAMVSQLGCVTLTPDTVRKAYAGATLEPPEAASFAAHPQVAHGLLASIPRLGEVAEMVRQQHTPQQLAAAPLTALPRLAVASEVLRVGLLYERLARRRNRPQVIVELHDRHAIHAQILDALGALRLSWDGEATMSLKLRELREGMVLCTDIQAGSGILLASAGTEVSATLLMRLHNFASSVGVREPVDVLVPRQEEKVAPVAVPARTRR